MDCPNCHMPAFEVDDLGDGQPGIECEFCGYSHAYADDPCPEGDAGEPCFFVDDEHGRPVCIACGRDEP